jgi:hypothetical protein
MTATIAEPASIFRAADLADVLSGSATISSEVSFF